MAAAGAAVAVRLFGREWPRASFPRMIVFDVDYTLRPYWVDTHTRAPYSSSGGKVIDGSKETIRLFPETEIVLSNLRQMPELQIAYASRMGQPKWLEQLAKLLRIAGYEGGSMWDLPDYQEIYPGSKLNHFRRLSEQSGIPCDEMLFFDAEPYSNMEVTQLGVEFVDAEDGITEKMCIACLEAFAAAREKLVGGNTLQNDGFCTSAHCYESQARYRD
jgi:magnesium-dependent phosphatase 1